MTFSERAETQFKALMSAAGGDAERAFRQRAWSEFARLGLPDRKSENWKYSSLTALTRGPWELASRDSNLPREALAMQERWSGDFDVIILMNGELRTPPPRGVSVLKFGSDPVEFEDGWIGLSVALARPGFDLRVEGHLARPLLIIHCQSEDRTWSPTFHRVVLTQGASAEIAEAYVGSGDGLRSDITVARLAKGASLNWVRVQYDGMAANHFSDVQSHLDESAKLHLLQINGGAQWSRSTVRADIHGEAAEAFVSGLTFARGQQHCDQRVEVRHRARATTSAQVFKGVLKDRARGVMNGKIFIARDAQKVSSSQLNHNLLLSPHAEADTKPELEVYADDVKANHGASVGRLDEDKMFYLMSRGITRESAQQMLARAFVMDVLMRMPSEPLVKLARASVEKILPAFAHELEANV